MGQETILMKYLPLTAESGDPQEENVLIFNNPGEKERCKVGSMSSIGKRFTWKEKDEYELTPVFMDAFMLPSWKEYL